MADDFDTLDRLMRARYSCRAFRPDPVPQQVIETIITTAGRAASWNNTQPWQLLVTRGAATDRLRAGLLEAIDTEQSPAPDVDWPGGYPDLLGERRRTCGYALYKAAGIAREDRAARARQSRRNFELFDAPHTAILHSPAILGPYGALDAGGFLTAFMLAAQAQGVQTIAQAAIAAYPQVIRRTLDLPQDRLVLCAITFGYEDGAHPVNQYRTDRAPLTEITRFQD